MGWFNTYAGGTLAPDRGGDLARTIADAPLRKAANVSSALRGLRYRAHRYRLAATVVAANVFWHQLLRPLDAPPWNALRELVAGFDDLIRQDLVDAEAGLYPAELIYSFPFRTYLRNTLAGLREATRVLSRGRRRDFALPPHLDSPDLPDYYRRTFHWQPDGWMSERSAQLYDAEVEFLFFGMADVLRRRAIAAIASACREPGARVLDLGCGTGRLLQQLAVARPRAALHGVDLSRFYLAEAARQLPPSVELHEANAESVPLPAESFDAITAVFLVHELPYEARRRVLVEARRLLKPGGIFAIVDSLQVCDVGPGSWLLRTFPRYYHEPYFAEYTRHDLREMLEECGFVAQPSRKAFLAKVASGRRRP
jgi:ubiquinone/menaquinone biosynthesis C-methylase UbiE